MTEDNEAVQATVNFCQPEIKALRQYALLNYDQGGHWVYETHDDADYARVLMSQAPADEMSALVAASMTALRKYWERLAMLEREYAFGDE